MNSFGAIFQKILSGFLRTSQWMALNTTECAEVDRIYVKPREQVLKGQNWLFLPSGISK